MITGIDLISMPVIVYERNILFRYTKTKRINVLNLIILFYDIFQILIIFRLTDEIQENKPTFHAFANYFISIC